MDPYRMIADNDPTLERLFKGHRGEVTGLSFNPDSTKLVSSGADSKLMLWSFNKNTRALSIENHSDSVTGVHFASCGNMFASCSRDKSVRVWKPSVKLSCKHFRAHTSAVRSIQMSPGSDTLLTASNDKSIKLWTTEYHNRFLSTFQGHTHWVNCARFSPNGTLIGSCSEDKTIKLWDQHTKYCVQTFLEKDGIPKHVEFHPNSKCIAACFTNNTIKIYDTRSPHKLLQFYNSHSGSVNQIAIHPNGHFMISASSDKTTKVFDLVEGRVLYTLEGHEGPVTAVTFSCDGHFFATGGTDKKILVWKSNFDKEVLAKPLQDNTSVGSKTSHNEQNIRNIDARKSFRQMEQPVDFEISSVQTSTSNSSDEEKPTVYKDEIDNSSPLKLTQENSTSTNGVDVESKGIERLFSDLKLQVTDMQNQLIGISTRLTTLENKINKTLTTDNLDREQF